MNRRTLFVLFALIISFAFIHYIKYIIINDEVEESTLEEVAILETDLGSILLKFFPNHAPATVKNFKTLIKDKFLDGCHFYRAQSNFCLQGGSWNIKKHNYKPIPLEYNIPNCKYKVSMARTSNPNSATTEFSIMLRDNSKWLGPNGSDPYGYAVFAEVIEGWNVIEHIMTLPTVLKGSTQLLDQPIKINHAKLLNVSTKRTIGYEPETCKF